MKKIVVTICILIFGLVLTVLYLLQAENITGITDELGKDVIKQSPKNEFLKGEKIKILFKANENYLGQFQFRFYNYNRINKDQVVFRIKENGDKNWFYENTYKTDQFQPNKLFPFGFPIIPYSKGKIYSVEIESVSGKPEDAVTISTLQPMSSIIYQYPKKEFLTNPTLLLEFISNKIIYTNYDRDFFVNIGKYLTFLLLSLILLYLSITEILIKRTFTLNISGVNVIALGLICIVLNMLILYAGKETLSRNVAIVGYFLIVLGIMLLVIEDKTKTVIGSHEHPNVTPKKIRKKGK